jgi:hypothetical protein
VLTVVFNSNSGKSQVTWVLLVLCDTVASTIRLGLTDGVRENNETTIMVRWFSMNSVPGQQIEDSLGEQFNIITLHYI